MLEEKTIAVVIPAYNEENLIGRVIDTLPDYVDRVIIVDDCSKDRTVEIVGERSAKDNRIDLVRHERNSGVGAAIVSGYQRAIELSVDVSVVMAGDAQMDPTDLPAILDPVVSGRADYTKGNRLFSGESWQLIPKARYIGNSALSFLTKIASGYWHVADSQTGYTAISSVALRRINLERVYPRYGVPNDLLVRLNASGCRVAEVPIKPIYNVGERSGIKIWRVVPTISWLLTRMFFWRLFQKYVIRDFHPLVFFYLAGLTMLPIGLLLGCVILVVNSTGPPYLPIGWIILCALLCISGSQSLFFAMWFDMDYNRTLAVLLPRDELEVPARLDAPQKAAGPSS